MLKLQFSLRDSNILRKYSALWKSQVSTRSYADTKDKVDLYNRLGLSSSATHAEIKKAYYDLTFKHHPDRNVDNIEASTKFREVTEAYEVLGNFGLRKRYDKGLPMPQMENKTRTSRSAIIEKDVKYQKFFDSRQSAQKFTWQDEIEGEHPQSKSFRAHEAHNLKEMDKSRGLQIPVMIFLVVIMSVTTLIYGK